MVRGGGVCCLLLPLCGREARRAASYLAGKPVSACAADPRGRRSVTARPRRWARRPLPDRVGVWRSRLGRFFQSGDTPPVCLVASQAMISTRRQRGVDPDNQTGCGKSGSPARQRSIVQGLTSSSSASCRLAISARRIDGRWGRRWIDGRVVVANADAAAGGNFGSCRHTLDPSCTADWIDRFVARRISALAYADLVELVRRGDRTQSLDPVEAIGLEPDARLFSPKWPYRAVAPQFNFCPSAWSEWKPTSLRNVSPEPRGRPTRATYHLHYIH